MEITVKTGNVLQEPSELAMLGCLEDSSLPGEVAGLLEPPDFTGKAKQTLLLYPRGAVAPRRLLLVGLGKRESVNVEVVRQAAATAVKAARELRVPAVTFGVSGELPLPADAAGQALAEGIALGAYRHWKDRTGLSTEQTFAVERATVFTSSLRVDGAREGIARGQVIARGVELARDLVNSPGYALTPAALGEEAAALGKRSGVAVTVLDKAQ